MKLSIIVAFDENRLIGKNNGLPWHLPADLKHFKSLTMGHCMIMGRRTFESIGKPLPGRTSIIVTRQKNYVVEGCKVVHTLNEALELCKNDNEVFIIGGAEIFKCALPLATNLYVTRIHHDFEGEVYFPEININEWQEISRVKHLADDKNHWDYTYINYERKK